MVIDLPGFLAQSPDNNLLIGAPIEAVAVWETVGALGIPEYTKSMLRIDVFRFADTKLSKIIQQGFQAIAVDERREDFAPTFWDTDPRVTQVLFPGAHADVGGGYPATNNESGLSDRTLKWMMNRLLSAGVQMAALPVFAPNPDFKGAAHQPWAYPPFEELPTGPRVFPAGYSLSKFVVDRMNAGPVISNPGAVPTLYTPGNLGAYLVGSAPAPGVVLV